MFITYLYFLLSVCTMQPGILTEPILIAQNAEAIPQKTEKPASEAARFDETIIVTATKSERSVFETPRAVAVETEEAYQKRSPVTALDSLDDQVGVWTELKTGTTSDPVIRGLSGANILALVDGNTVTTLWGEGGYGTDDLYGKIDSEMIERIEVVKGPSSVLYGSNCLGGVINFITKSSPFSFEEEGFKIGVRGKIGYDSVSEGQRYRLEMYGALPKIRFLLGGSFRDLNDLQGARGQGTLYPTSGEDKNVDAKLEFLPQTNHLITVTYQNTNRDNIHRFYRPTQENFNDRDAYSVSYNITELSSLLSSLEFRLYYQDKQDRRTDATNRKTGIAPTKTMQAHIQAVTKTEQHKLTYGLQYEHDDGVCPDDEQFKWTSWDTGIVSKDSPDSIWQNYGVFIQDEWKVVEKLDVIGGVRYDGFDFKSDPDEQYNPPHGEDREIDRMHNKTSALTGSLSFLYRLNQGYNLFGNVSRGFRQFPPSFGVTQHGQGIVVPNNLQDPATSLGFELGYKQNTPNTSGSFTTYYTKFSDFPTLKATTFQGKDWYDYNNNGQRDAEENTFSFQGGIDAYIYGAEVDYKVKLMAVCSRIAPELYTRCGASYDYAQDETNDVPFRHGTPPRALLSFGWEGAGEHKIWWEFGANFVDKWDRVSDTNLLNDRGYRVDPKDMDSPLVRSYGLPGYTTFNVRGGYTFDKHIEFSMAIENLTDKHYRRAHSRMDDPGTNVRGTLTFNY